MLERLLKPLNKFFLPAAILFSLIPSKSFANYLSFVNFNGKDYIVEIDDKKEQIQVNAENNGAARKAAYKALINQKAEALKRDIHALEYESIQSIWGPIKSSQDLANKISYISNLLGLKLKLPWWPLALKSPKDFSIHLNALEDAWKYRNSALKLIEASKYSSSKVVYDNLCLTDDSTQKMTDYMVKIRETSKTPADMVKRDEIKFAFEELWKTFNLDKAEKMVNNMAERYSLKNKEIESLTLEMRKLEENDNNEFRDSLKCRNLSEIIKDYKIILEPTVVLHEKDYSVPLFTSGNLEFQTPKGREYANLSIKVEKTNIKNKDYNLRIFFKTDCAFSKVQTNLYLIYSKNLSLERRITQTALNIKNQKDEYEETVPLGEDKAIILELNASEAAVSETISSTMKGYIIKTNNILKWLGGKIYDLSLQKDKQILLMLTRAFGRSYDQEYIGRQIMINPVQAGRETVGYIWLVPVHEKKPDPCFVYSNIGINSSSQPKNKFGSPNEKAFNRKTVLIPINGDIKYNFDSKLCDEFFNDSMQKMLAVQKDEDLENLNLNEILKSSKLNDEKKSALERDFSRFSKWIDLNPVQYIASALYFEGNYIYDTAEYIKGFYPPACDYPDCEYEILKKTKELFFGAKEENIKKEKRYFAEEIDIKFGNPTVIKSKTYPVFQKIVD